MNFCLALFCSAQIVSIFGDRLNQFSVVGMIGRVEAGSSVELLKLALFTHLPVLLFAPLLASLIDRWHRGAVLILSDLFRGVLVLFLPALFDRTGTLYAFYVPVAALSLANLLFAPAKSALIPELVEPSRLMKINALLWGLGIAGTICGFLLGGWLFDYRSWHLSFYADGASYIFSVLLLLPLLRLPRCSDLGSTGFLPVRRSIDPRVVIEDLGRSIAEGFRLIRENRVVAVCLVAQSSLFLLAGFLYVTAIAHVQEVSPPDKTMLLAIMAGSGTIGLLLGSLIAGSYRAQFSSQHVLSVSTLLIGISILGIAKSYALVALSIWSGLLGIAVSPVIIHTETLLQRFIPERFRGRVFTAREVLTKTSFLIASILSALLNLIFDKVSILAGIGLFLALLGVILDRKKLLEVPQE